MLIGMQIFQYHSYKATATNCMVANISEFMKSIINLNVCIMSYISIMILCLTRG